MDKMLEFVKTHYGKINFNILFINFQFLFKKVLQCLKAQGDGFVGSRREPIYQKEWLLKFYRN